MTSCKYTEYLDTMNEQEFTVLQHAVLSAPGMHTAHDSGFIYDTFGDNIALKFMSDQGVTDDSNGIALANHLRASGIQCQQTRPRSLTVSSEAFVKLFIPGALISCSS